LLKDDRNIPITQSAYQYPLIIKQLLHTPRLYAPKQEIVYRDLQRHTYEEFYGRIARLASGLSSLGVGPRDTVGVLDWDGNRYLECFFALPMMGAVLHTVNIRLSPQQILYTMNHAEDTVVLVHEDFVPVLESIADKLETVKTIILLKDGEEAVSTNLPIATEYEELLEKSSDSYNFPEFDENRQATTFYTTGTTGLPKGVYFSHRQLVVHTLSVGMATAGFSAPGKFHSADVYMPLTPMFHVHAWGFPFVATLLGAKQVYPGKFDPEMVLRLIDAEKVTFSHCVATILQMILSHPVARDIDLSNWKVNTGGMALPRGLAEEAMDRGIDIFQGYGLSESCPILTMANLKQPMLEWDRDRQLGVRTKTGLPLPLVDLQIQDSQGRPVPRDGESTGEITVRTPWLTQGYFKEIERSEELWAGGRMHTGDVAHQDKEGYVQITDRLKDVIKSGGEWISSLELESLLSRHEAVYETAVVGAPDDKWGERPIAFVVRDPEYDGNVTDAELKEFLMAYVADGTLSKWAVPETIRFVESLPKTSVGKMDKKTIRTDIV
jgi:acyl-CoA synthetase (AMP-forming)/AMP-acid ligase II